MAAYRFYFFQPPNTMFDQKNAEHADDDAAMRAARDQLHGQIHIEVWDGKRKVGTVGQQETEENPPVRMPERSEEVSGNEDKEGLTPISASTEPPQK